MGREVHDCPSNAGPYFSDTGFHIDFRDRHNGYAWGYIAQTAVPGAGVLMYPNLGLSWLVGSAANVAHEVVQSKAGYDGGWGTSCKTTPFPRQA